MTPLSQGLCPGAGGGKINGTSVVRTLRTGPGGRKLTDKPSEKPFSVKTRRREVDSQENSLILILARSSVLFQLIIVELVWRCVAAALLYLYYLNHDH